MNGEIFFNFHPSVVGGFVAWNHSETEADKHLIVVEGDTFEAMGAAARSALALAWEGKTGHTPLLLCFRQTAHPPEGALLESGGGTKDLLQWLMRRANASEVRHDQAGHVALAKLGPRHGLLVAPLNAVRPETTFLVTHSVRDWCWNALEPKDQEAYAAWLKARPEEALATSGR